jgi:hypothetical protein
MWALHIAAILEGRLRSHSNDTLLYFFCNDKDAKQNNGTAILRGLIYQFAQSQLQLIEAHCASRPRQDNYRKTTPSFGALWDMLALMLNDKKVGNVFCIIDGVDECDLASCIQLL